MDKPIKSFKQHIDSTKLSLPKVANQTDINKYRNHPLIKTLNITDIEFKKFGSLIKRIVDEETQCLANPDRCFSNKNQHLRLIRGQNGKLHPIIVPCEKTLQLAIIREKYLIRSFPDSFLNVHLSPTFFKKNDPSKIAILNIYKSYVNHKQIEHGIYVYGDMGIGKTYTSIALANEMASLGFSIAFIFVPDIVYELKQGFGQERNNNQQIMDKMKFADILFLDDFGAENNSTWFYNEHLLIILNYRMGNNKPTFFNSNLSMEEMEKKLFILMNRSINAKRLMERVKALTSNMQYHLKGINKRY